MHFIQKKTLVSFVMAFYCATALPIEAEDDESDVMDKLTQYSLESLLNLQVVSASKISTKVSEAPVVVSAYTQKQMDDYGFNVINDLLYTLPGFGPSQDYDRPTVSTRGNFDNWNNNHILHLVDGVPFNDNLYGSAYTWLVPTFTTKVMEVNRGPGSALYGSSATNGVVQMNTFNAKDLEKQLYAKFSLAGSDATARYQFMTGNVSGEYDFIMAFSIHETDGNEYLGYDGSGRGLEAQVGNSNTPNAEQFYNRDKKADSYFWTKLSHGKNWQFQYHHQEWDFDTGHGWVFWSPDFDEEMNESRDIFSIKYNGDINERLSQEYVLRYQHHAITWNQRYYPDGAFSDFYPSGMWEFLDTDASDIFFRAQYTWKLENRKTFLLGFEGDRFIYDGDKAHFSNIDVDSELGEPFPGNVNTQLGPWLDYIMNEPVINTAFYAQYTSGDWIENFEITAGIRWDRLAVEYREIYTPGQPKRSKNLSKVSPRIAGVWNAREDLVMKLMWGKAFRAPTPTEMAGAHTFSLASNISELAPEIVSTTEGQLNWNFDSNHVMRANLFLTNFENQIAYSTVNLNLSTNIYSTENIGYEIELLGNYGDWNWFTNVSAVARQSETILAFDENGNPEFSNHPNDIMWEPDLKINFGAAVNFDDWQLSFTAHYHGDIKRRDSDRELIPYDCNFDGVILGEDETALPLGVCVDDRTNLDDHRGAKVGSWVSFNSKAKFNFNESVSATIEVRNLFNESGYLAKTGPFPFDYRIQGRQVIAYMEIEF